MENKPQLCVYRFLVTATHSNIQLKHRTISDSFSCSGSKHPSPFNARAKQYPGLMLSEKKKRLIATSCVQFVTLLTLLIFKPLIRH